MVNMDKIKSFINTMHAQGVLVTLDNGSLKTRGAIATINSDQANFIRAHKTEIVEFLSELNARKQRSAQIEALNQSSGPLSYAQQRLWMMQSQDKQSNQYNIAFGFEIKGDFLPDIAEKALQQIINRHQILRTNYVIEQDKPVQKVRDKVEFSLSVIVISEQSEDLTQNKIAQLTREFELATFDLKQDLMIKVQCLQVSEEYHVLLFNINHIAFDGWSAGIFQQEFEAIYNATRQGQTAQLPQLNIQYCDYANWQLTQSEHSKQQQAIKYWTQQLTGMPLVHSLVLDRSRLAKQSSNGDLVNFDFDTRLSTQIKHFCQQQGLTTAMFLQSAFALLVAKKSHQSDVVLGVPVANREHQDLQPLIGFFVNMLVMRSNCAAEQSVAEFLAQVKNNTVNALKYQNVPFDQLVEIINPTRNRAIAPLVQLVFSMHQRSSSTLNLGNVQVKSLDSDLVRSQFELLMNVIEGDNFHVSLEFNTDLFNKDTVQTLLAQYQETVQFLLQDSTKPLSDCVYAASLLGNKAWSVWTSGTQPAEVTQNELPNVLQLFDARLASHPERIALIFNEQAYSYQKVDELSRKLAGQLVSKGAKPGELVALYGTRSAWQIMAVLAILRSGAAYLPMDESWPLGRIKQVLGLSSACCIVADLNKLESIEHIGVPVIGCAPEQWQQGEVFREADTTDPKQPAYVIYTSGTTGEPKGVVISHRSLADYVKTATDLYYHDVVGGVICTSLSFDATVTSLWLPLCNGGKVIIVPKTRDEISLLQQLLQNSDSQNWLFKLTPSHLKALHQTMLGSSLSAHMQHQIVVGGEALAARDVELLTADSLQHSHIYNEYGPSEATVGCTVYKVPRQSISGDSLPIGIPMKNTQVRIMNEQGILVTPGEIGELYVAGICLATEYLNNPDKTSSSFVNVTTESGKAERFYKTGDYVRCLEDGNLIFINRIDEQVKFNGYRIETAEIKQVVLRNNAVLDCVIVPEIVNGQINKLVAACILTTEASEPQTVLRERVTEQLVKQLKHSLPAYMVPGVIGFVETFPMTINGKLDKVRLLRDLQVQTKVRIVPESEEETKMLMLWARLLNQQPEAISTDARFFEIGGHSLLAVSLLHGIKLEFQAEVGLDTLYDLTLRELLGEIFKLRVTQSLDAAEKESGRPMFEMEI